MKASEFAEVYDAHDATWTERRPELKRLRAAYLMRFWERGTGPQASLLVETSRAYELVESYVASLFSRDPSVVLAADLHGAGDYELSQKVVNIWLRRTRQQIEDAIRLSLIYPNSFLKLSPVNHPDVLNRVQPTAVGPWDIIIDEAAPSWDSMRYVGHRYLIPLEKAKELYGNKRYSARCFSRFLESVDADKHISGRYRTAETVKDRSQFVLIVEYYDLIDNKMRIWSPDYDRTAWLYDGIELPVGVGEETPERFNSIPYMTVSGRVVLPIIPLYLSREPDDPLKGYSALRRVYDQVQEVNVMRTYQANGIRKAARQWMVAKGALDPETRAKIAQGVDGEFIEVELSPGQELTNIMFPVPHSPLPPELEGYAQIVDSDFARGSVMAPFSRGQATNATATEVQALAAYTASEIGRMARERDSVIAALAQGYLTILAVLLGNDAEIIRLNNEARTIVSSDLLGDFEYYAQDSGTTPMDAAIRKQEFSSLVPLLQQLGVPNSKILESLVKQFDLPDSFLAAEENLAPVNPDVSTALPTAPDAEADIAGMNAGPDRIMQVLPPGGVV